MENIYLDNAATTPVDSRVADAMLPYYRHGFGNASSVHRFGREAKVMLEDARDLIADFTGTRSSEIYFTSGGTEANNFALKGTAFNRVRGHIISSRIEHSAVIDTLEYLQSRFGFRVSFVNNYENGSVDLEHLKTLITDDTFLISIMHANNEIGVLNDVKAAAEIANENGVVFHTDTVQSLGKTPFNISDLKCSLASFSAHKIYGPKGIGALFIKKGVQIDKIIHGGSQERDRRGGTENVAAIAGFKKAVEILKSEMDSDLALYKKLKEKLTASIKKTFGDNVIFNSPADKSLNNILNISFKGIETDPDTLLIKLDLKGIAVSSGSACTSGSIKPSHVIKALGYDDNLAKSSLRISFGRFNKESDVDELVTALKEILRS